ncbi:MAG: thioesterase family protein [Polyangiales bacterium]
MADAFFEPRSATTFVPTPHARGPWNDAHLHGGPPAALLARALEQHAPTGFRIVRITYELLRPVPFAELETHVEVDERGKNVRRARATLVSGGKPLLEARAVLFAEEDVALPPLPDEAPPPSPDGVAAYTFPFFRNAVGYHTAIELRYARGRFGESPVLAWIRMRVPLLADETPSPLVRVVVAADSGNGVSPRLDTDTHTFVNPDLGVHLFRPARGEWIGLEAHSTIGERSVGLADTRLWDAEGPVGRGTQSLLVRAR